MKNDLFNIFNNLLIIDRDDLKELLLYPFIKVQIYDFVNHCHNGLLATEWFIKITVRRNSCAIAQGNYYTSLIEYNK